MLDSTCLSCGKAVTYRFALCARCEATYGKSALNWPAWLRYLWNDTQRERRQHIRTNLHEVPASAIEEKGMRYDYDDHDLDVVQYQANGRKIRNHPPAI